MAGSFRPGSQSPPPLVHSCVTAPLEYGLHLVTSIGQNTAKVMDVAYIINLQNNVTSILLTHTLSLSLSCLLTLVKKIVMSWDAQWQGTKAEPHPPAHEKMNLTNKYVSELGSRFFPVKSWNDSNLLKRLWNRGPRDAAPRFLTHITCKMINV